MATFSVNTGAPNFSEGERTALKKAFDTFDEDRSETIDSDELTKILALLGREVSAGEVIRMIASVDSNNSGVISYEDFLTLMWRRKKEKEVKEIYQQAFRSFNHNATGKLNAAELKQIMISLGLSATPEEVDEVLFEADEDEDHFICFDEFVAIMQRALVDGMKSPSRRGWTVEHNHAMESWIAIATNVSSLVNQSACAKKCVKPQRLFRSMNYPKAAVHKESGKNVQAAISQCRDGDTVLLAEGKYTEPIVIHHDGMTLAPQEGEGQVIIEVTSKQPAITIKSRYAKLSGITVINHEGPAISIEQGYCELDSLTVSGSAAGILIKNRSFPTVTNSTISNCARGPGIGLKESRAIIENCHFSGNYDGGIVAERSCNPWIGNCVVENGHNSGIVFTEGALGTIVNTKITNNSTQGLYIDNAANPLVYKCEFVGGKASGVKMMTGARATIQECVFSRNADHDIDSESEGAPLVVECEFEGGSTTSISVTKKGGITLERCNFNNYPLAAVNVDDGRAVIVDNKFRCDPTTAASSKLCGLIVGHNSAGKAVGNSFVGWKNGIHEGRAAMQFADSPAFTFHENVVQETEEQAEAENIVNLLGGDIMRRKSLKV